jgi:D-glycero-D-manno-heptose 1,7-bisphosphate phosphatase
MTIRLARPALFLDRDGVLNVDRGYVHTSEQFEWIAGAPEAIRWANTCGYRVIVVTNQSGIARGYYDAAHVESLSRWMQSVLHPLGATIDATYFCPHHPTEGNAPFRMVCPCRKPAPGMLEQAIREWNIDRARSLMIGDSPRDIEAARRAGIVGHLFDGSNLEALVQTLLAPIVSSQDCLNHDAQD